MSAGYTYAPDSTQRSPYMGALQHQPAPYGSPGGGQVAPGSITYTTSTGPDGRLIYHPFKAVAASYQTPNGVVSGIQWVPAEATSVMPAGAQMANAEFAASWNRGQSNKEQESIKKWQKDEEKRRKKEEKEAAKRLKERDANELRKARERDAMANERRKSFNEPGYPNMQSGYNPNLYNYSPAGGPADLDRRFGDMGIDKQSPLGRPRKYSSNEGDPTAGGAHSISPYGSPYANPGYPANTRSSTYPSYGPASSPNARPTDFPPRSTTPVPGPAAGIGMPQPTIPNTGGPPYTSPVTFGAEQPQQLAAPEAFSRPVNAAQPYTPFETTKIQDMDDFPDNMPRLPLALQSHDVFHEDWIRLMQDITRAWTGTLPVPELAAGGRAPKRATLTADLIDVWNRSFFLARGVEVALYKGHEKRSGPDAGTIDPRLPAFNRNDDSSSSSSTSSDSSDLSGEERYGQTGHGYYGRDSAEAKHRRQEKKAEKKRRAKEKKQRKKAKEREKTYALYIIWVPQGGGAHHGYPPMGGQTNPMPGIHGIVGPTPINAPMPGGYGAMGGRTSPMPGGIIGPTPIGGRSSPMPGGYPPLGGRTSPMPGGYPPLGGRTSPMPGGPPMGGRTSPMPGGYNAMGGRTSPMPGGRSSPMPAPYTNLGGRSSPMPGGRGY